MDFINGKNQNFEDKRSDPVYFWRALHRNVDARKEVSRDCVFKDMATRLGLYFTLSEALFVYCYDCAELCRPEAVRQTGENVCPLIGKSECQSVFKGRGFGFD